MILKRHLEPQGTVARIARLLALAHHIQELIDTGQVRDVVALLAGLSKQVQEGKVR